MIIFLLINYYFKKVIKYLKEYLYKKIGKFFHKSNEFIKKFGRIY